MNVGLVVPVLNNFKGIAELLWSLECRSLKVTPIVVDNWNENRGVSASWNFGLHKASNVGCDLVLVCNDDILFAPNTLPELVAAYYEDSHILVTANNVRDDMGPYDITEVTDTGTMEIVEGPDYSCWMGEPGKLLSEIGLFDENFYPAYFEDNDHHYRIRLAGHKAGRVTSAWIYHRGSVTQNKDRKRPVVPPKQFRSNRRYYISKWGGPPGQEVNVHPYNNEDYDFKYWRK